MYKIAICDDDEKLCFTIENYIITYGKELCEIISIDVFFTGEELYSNIIKGKYYDLLYLDIELPSISGIEVGKKIREELQNNYTQIIYISSYKKYMEELFRIRPMDFLSKPITELMIKDTLKMGFQLCEQKNEMFTYQIGWEYYKKPISDILYFEGVRKVINMITINECISFHGTLKSVYDSLDNFYFIYTDRSHIVNYKYIATFTRNKLTLINGIQLPVSRNRYPDLIVYQQNLEKNWFNKGGKMQ